VQSTQHEAGSRISQIVRKVLAIQPNQQFACLTGLPVVSA